MRVLLFANNWVGWQIARVLGSGSDEIVGAVLHPPERRRFGSELLETLQLPGDRLIDAAALHSREGLEKVAAMRPDIGVSAMFGYILRPPLLAHIPSGCINVHPALLPYNRGSNPNVWSIVDNTPAGVTIHYIDEGVDTGDIVAQMQVPVEPVDTAATLYRRLEQASVALFRDTWPALQAQCAPRRPQSAGGTYHRLADLAELDALDPERRYTARELIDILRARTFAPYPGAYLEIDGRRVYVRVELTYE